MNSDAVKFSIIVPTCGRPSLYATLASVIAAGVRPSDQVIVVADGRQLEAQMIVSAMKDRLPLKYLETEPTNDSGNHQRNHGMDYATGSHLLFLDDDDVYVNGALTIIRKAVIQNPVRVHLFKMRGLAKRLFYDVLWTEKVVRMGNIGTPMACIPDVAAPHRWGKNYWADFGFIQSAVAATGNEPVWVDEVVAHIH